MRKPHLNFKFLGLAALFSIIIVGAGFYINTLYINLADEIIETNEVLCEVLASQLNNSSSEKIAQLSREKFFITGYLSSETADRSDSMLSLISDRVLSLATGAEGGYYFIQPEKFFGYAYPTSPPPKPVYGPPPRSYGIIQKQILQTIAKDSVITQLHKFDPAIFPLATVPIKVDNKIIGATWARTHIERELPKFNLSDILNITAVFSLLGFIIAVWFSVKQKKRLDTIRIDLQKLEEEPNFRVRNFPGIFGYIAQSINKMVDALQAENKRRDYLEKELHQKDKMASIGKLIAGVAHEVKTPLAIIKTRIQIWQQKLNSKSAESGSDELISSSAMQMVINEINRLSILVNRLLIFSKPASDSLSKVNINNIISDVLMLFKTDRYSEKAEIEFLPGEYIPELKIDPNKIEQVMINIISNAYEAIEVKGKIKISTSHSGNKIKISVSDNGGGIAKESMSNIFDPFYSTKESGTGLGLSIASEIIKAHKGKIEFESALGKGSIFTISLPINQNKLLG
jgi:signal transduction histidine kinase